VKFAGTPMDVAMCGVIGGGAGGLEDALTPGRDLALGGEVSDLLAQLAEVELGAVQH
jgi:hypothetical protein